MISNYVELKVTIFYTNE